MTLTEQAQAIINQKARCNEDITELSKIAFNMAVYYAKYKQKAGVMEAEYNLTRVEESRIAREWGASAWDSEQIGKLKAEIKFWKYRELKDRLVGMKAVMDQIDAFRIAYYVNEKWIDNALYNKNK